jgi:hypothetical protein
VNQWSKERYEKFERKARALFEEISKSVGTKAAQLVFKKASSTGRRLRRTEYGDELNEALSIHAFWIGSPTKTANLAIKLGLEPGAKKETLRRHITYLLKARRAPSDRDK